MIYRETVIVQLFFGVLARVQMLLASWLAKFGDVKQVLLAIEELT
jgi:hypothetical protein